MGWKVGILVCLAITLTIAYETGDWMGPFLTFIGFALVYLAFGYEKEN